MLFRYCNIDYVLLSTLVFFCLYRLIISYDISCRYSVNFRKRISEYPDDMVLDTEFLEWDAVIPQWHVNGHKDKCQTEFSFNYLAGVGRSCGEDVESGWYSTNPLGTSVREMGPAARHETLNDHWGSWNFQKIVGLRELHLLLYFFILTNFIGALFSKRFKDAMTMRSKHREISAKFTATFSPAIVNKWEVMIADWLADKKKPNPYQEPMSCKFVIILSEVSY